MVVRLTPRRSAATGTGHSCLGGGSCTVWGWSWATSGAETLMTVAELTHGSAAAACSRVRTIRSASALDSASTTRSSVRSWVTQTWWRIEDPSPITYSVADGVDCRDGGGVCVGECVQVLLGG